MKKVKKTFQAMGRWAVRWSPEALLVLFGLSLLPLLYYVGSMGVQIVRHLFSQPEAVGAAIQASPWSVAAWAICGIGVLVVGWIIFRSRDTIWAVARKMIIEALHRKVVVGLLVFFIVLMPSLRFILQTEGSLKSQIQIVLTYSLTLAEVLLSLVAVFVCTASICSEIEKKQVFVVDTKPMPRWQFLVGKLAGVVVMSAALLFLMGGAVYGLVTHMARPRNWDALPPWEAEKKKEMVQKVQDEVLVARTSRRPVLPDVTDGVRQELEKLEERGELRNRAKQGAQIAERLQKRSFTVQPGAALMLTIPGLRPGSDAPVYMRFKPARTNPEAPEQVRGMWMFYMPRRSEEGEGVEFAPAYRHTGKWVTDAYQEIEIPASVVTPMGTIQAAYWNFQQGTGVQFDPREGIECLQRVGGFFPNYYRSLLVILCHIVVLSALALMAGAALSFPVASFTVGAILLLGLLGPWVAGTALGAPQLPADASVGQMVLAALKAATTVGLKAIFFVLPQFGRFSPMGDLVNGRLVSWGLVSRAAAIMCFIKGGAAILLGMYFYWRRELARVIA